MSFSTTSSDSDQPEIHQDEVATDHPIISVTYPLMLQHLSSVATERTAEFAIYLFLIAIYPFDLLKPSIYGFCTTASTVLFASSVCHLIDIWPRLYLIRVTTFVQKSTVVLAYATLLLLLSHRSQSEPSLLMGHLHPPLPVILKFHQNFLYGFVIISGCAMRLSDVCRSVAIERDWLSCICHDSSADLTCLNTWIRRIDLSCKLVTPLLVTLLSSTIGPLKTMTALASLSVAGFFFELAWIHRVWSAFPILAEINQRARQNSEDEGVELRVGQASSARQLWCWLRDGCTQFSMAWISFVKLPIFPSSLAISLLYFTVLSFDGSMIVWLKTQAYSDGTISGVRGLGVLTGLMGTFLMPWLESKISLIRAGGWTIWLQFLCLIPVVVSLYLDDLSSSPSMLKPALLFGGIALSRMFLWAFDLCQLKQFQSFTIAHNIAGLQYSLQNTFDLLRFLMMIRLHKPSEFKLAGALSLGSVFLASASYSIYMWRERGHLFHLHKLIDKFRKND